MTLNPVSSTLPLSTSYDVVVELNVGTEQVSSADLVMSFDPVKLEVVKVSEVIGGTKVFPVNTVSIDNATGRVVVNSSMSEVTESFTGRSDWVILSLASKTTPGQAQLNFTCLDGDVTDTNVMQKGTGVDIVNCAGLVSGVYTVSSSAPTFTPTPTIDPIGTGGIGGEATASATDKGGATGTPTPRPTMPVSGVVEDTISFLVIGLGMVLLAGFMWRVNKS